MISVNKEKQKVRSGYKKSELGIIPESWTVANLGAIGRFKNGINKDGESFGHGDPFVNLMDVFGKTSIGTIKSLGLIDSTDFDKKEYDLRAGDVLFIRSSVKPSGIGLTAVVKEDLMGAVYSGFLIRYRSDSKLSTSFKEYCFYDSEFRKRVIAASSVSANTNINQDNLKQLLLAFPESLAEQAAIANSLSDVDALITSLEKLIDKKRAIKTAAMQQLLTGKMRLPPFDTLNSKGKPPRYKQTELGKIPEDWDVTTIGEQTMWMSGGTPSRSTERYWQGSIPWISGSTLKSIEISTSDQFITPEAVLAGSKIAPIGSVLILVRGSALHNVIRAGIVVAAVAFNQDVKALIPSKYLDSRFLTFYFLAKESEFLKLVSSAGNSAGVLDTELIKNFKMHFPGVEEQVAIADILSEMGSEIDVLEQRLNKTQQLKQGMMHELLTGRTRLV